MPIKLIVNPPNMTKLGPASSAVSSKKAGPTNTTDIPRGINAMQAVRSFCWPDTEELYDKLLLRGRTLQAQLVGLGQTCHLLDILMNARLDLGSSHRDANHDA